MKNFYRVNLYCCILLVTTLCASLQAQQQYKINTVAFYNIENLWDITESVDIIDGSKSFTDPAFHYNIPLNSEEANTTEECKTELTYEKLQGIKCKRVQVLSDDYTPTGKSAWDQEKYTKKIDHIVQVLLEIGVDDTNKQPPIVIGLAEVENEHVMKDIINHPKMKAYDYGFVHFNSFDPRGIDVALLYQKKHIIISKATPHVVYIKGSDGNRVYTRDILQVDAYLEGEKMHFFVNHWPSRSGGEEASRPRRITAAETLKHAIDSLYIKEPTAKIMIMGDFNDGPRDASIQSLGVVAKKQLANKELLFNAMLETSKKGGGTAAYKDSWETLDQLMINYNLLGKDLSTYQLLKTGVFQPAYLQQTSGKMKGYPFRTYSYGIYTGGYSDHFPVYLQLIKEK